MVLFSSMASGAGATWDRSFKTYAAAAIPFAVDVAIMPSRRDVPREADVDACAFTRRSRRKVILGGQAGRLRTCIAVVSVATGQGERDVVVPQARHRSRHWDRRRRNLDVERPRSRRIEAPRLDEVPAADVGLPLDHGRAGAAPRVVILRDLDQVLVKQIDHRVLSHPFRR